MAGGLMQLVSVSYKLLVTSDTSNHVIHDPLEQDLEIQDLQIQEPILFSIQLHDAIKEEFDTAQPGEIFHISIVASYNYSNSNIPYVQKSYPDIPIDFVPNPKIPNLLVTSPINKDTSISGFSAFIL